MTLKAEGPDLYLEKYRLKMGGTIVRSPQLCDGAFYKGVVICNMVDDLVHKIPHVKRYFWLVERIGWFGVGINKLADVRLLDDFSEFKLAHELAPNAVLLPCGNPDFVDTAVFVPSTTKKDIDVLAVANWQPFKRHRLLIDALIKCKDMGRAIKAVMFGHFIGGGTRAEIKYRDDLIEYARAMSCDIQFPYSSEKTFDGRLFSPEHMANWIGRAKIGVLCSKYEGINRFKMECLSSDVPVVICDDAIWTVRKHITRTTGLMAPPTPEGLANGILDALDNLSEYKPREYILASTGINRSMTLLQDTIDTLDERMGAPGSLEIASYDGRNESIIWSGFFEILAEETQRAKRQLPLP